MLPGVTSVTDNAGLTGTGTHAGVGVGVGVAGVVGDGVGVTTGGDPGQIATLITDRGMGVGAELPPPPPQLKKIAAAI
jgi:hypothetical protein